MSNYLGCECIVCKKKFEENDDVVVCPECGTPYHRECYVNVGKCINVNLHEKGESWKPLGGEQSKCKKCKSCGRMNKPHTIMCEQCGKPLIESLEKNVYSNDGFGNMQNGTASEFKNAFGFDPNDKYCGIDPEEDFDSVKLKDISDFVGSNQLYYLPLFKRMKDTKKKFSFNITAFFVPQLYFAYRKMWLWVILSIVISTVLSIPYIIYVLSVSPMLGGMISGIDIESSMFNTLYNVSNFVNVIFQSFMLVFANYLYYKHSVNKIKKIKSNSENADLSYEGGTSIPATIISFAVQMVVLMIIMMIFVK